MSPDAPIRLELTIAQVNVILAALSKQPLEAVIEVFAAVREQAARQVQTAPEGPAPNGKQTGYVTMREGEP
jgi:hypothetical protein